MADKPNDSPAFRLRPRSEPKSYYTIRLEYSANPAAFTRERPRSSLTKRRGAKSSYSKSKSRKHGGKAAATVATAAPGASQGQAEAGQVVRANVMSKEEVEREEKRKQLQRELSQSISNTNMISPFLQRLELEQLKHSSVYELNYVTMRIESITRLKQAADSPSTTTTTTTPGTAQQSASQGGHLICRCSSTDDAAGADEDANDQSAGSKKLYLNVHLYNEFARDDLVKVGKIMSVAKFRTGPPRARLDATPPPTTRAANGGSAAPALAAAVDDDDELSNGERAGQQLDFDVIVRYDGSNPSNQTGAASGSAAKKRPLIPYVCITDMIEEPTDPYVDAPLPSPPLPSQLQQPKPYLPEGGIAGGNYGGDSGATSSHHLEAKVPVASD